MLHLLDALYLRCNAFRELIAHCLRMLHLLDALYLRCNRRTCWRSSIHWSCIYSMHFICDVTS